VKGPKKDGKTPKESVKGAKQGEKEVLRGL
jgi:hypothetical protein